MDHLPIFLNVKGSRSLVVGGDFLALPGCTQS
jgi:siroheme synthase (precorrin-2 oxidase/ferrochelatase)